MKDVNHRVDLRSAPGEEENETSDLDAKSRSVKPNSTSRARKVRRGPGGKEKP